MCYPGTGNTVSKAVDVLMDHNVKEDNIILLNLFCTPQGMFCRGTTLNTTLIYKFMSIVDAITDFFLHMLRP